MYKVIVLGESHYSYLKCDQLTNSFYKQKLTTLLTISIKSSF